MRNILSGYKLITTDKRKKRIHNIYTVQNKKGHDYT